MQVGNDYIRFLEDAWFTNAYGCHPGTMSGFKDHTIGDWDLKFFRSTEKNFKIG